MDVKLASNDRAVMSPPQANIPMINPARTNRLNGTVWRTRNILTKYRIKTISVRNNTQRIAYPIPRAQTDVNSYFTEVNWGHIVIRNFERATSAGLIVRTFTI